MATGRKLAFWLIALSLPLILALLGLGYSSYWTIAPTPMRIEGDPIIAYDAEIGFVPRPNSRTRRTDVGADGRLILSYHLLTDRRGARVTSPGEGSPAHVDVVTIGCSFTWGHGFENEDTFAAKVAQALGVTGSNFAMGSYGTVQSLQMLRRNLDLAPKLVVYGFIADHLKRNVTPCAPSYYPFCLDYSHVAWGRDGQAAIAPPIANGVKRAQLQHKAEVGWLDPVTWIAHGLDVAFGRMTLAWSRAHQADSARQEATMSFLMEQLAETVGSMGAKLLVVYIPDASSANRPPPAVLLRSVAKLNFLFLDMTEAFARGDPSTYYIPRDGHPSVAGHALIAEEIIKLVRREKIL
jgi:hypothetical protein